jgi:endoglucanase
MRQLPEGLGRHITGREVTPRPLSGRNLIAKSSFEDGTWSPWWTHYVHPGLGFPSVRDGKFCFTLTSNAHKPWDAQFHHGHMVAQKGHTYSIKFTISASCKVWVYAIAGHPEPPYTEHWARLLELDATPQVVEAAFVMQEEDAAFELAFALGGELAAGVPLPFTVSVCDVHVDDPEFVPVAKAPEPEVPNVLVNQVGYFPEREKLAVVKSAQPLAWQLLNAAGDVVQVGTTRVTGADAASGEDLSLLDFSSFQRAGQNYRLRVGDWVSQPFDIRDDLYAALKYQAFGFLYHQRSGIPITMPYAGEPRWTHPAGHLGQAPNRGDTQVRCLPGTGGDYALDVRGGWYDSDLHDKSMWVLGITNWLLLNWWERTTLLGTSAAEFGDGRMNVPGAGDGVPDLLKEARWGLDFVLRMQVPEGEPLAGMCHHGVRDEHFTDMGTGPHEDPQPRYLLPPSTAATLVLAANAAQAARVWRTLDPAFSERCSTTAERAWLAALAHPSRFFVAGLGGYDSGGGDDDVSDELYWAAAELFVTTGQAKYRDFLRASPYYCSINTVLPAKAEVTASSTPIGWHRVAAMGSFSLAIVPNELGGEGVGRVRAAIVEAANRFRAVAHGEGYRIPLAPSATGYPWSSNWDILNSLIAVALAFDLTRDAQHLDVVVAGVDYLMGRNSLDQCFVTGVGSRPLRYPTHRFFANQSDPRYPLAPPGILSGGPNSGLEDQHVMGLGLRGRPPAKCYCDHLAAFSVNDCSVSWNASLAWVLAFLDEACGSAARARSQGGRP